MQEEEYTALDIDLLQFSSISMGGLVGMGPGCCLGDAGTRRELAEHLALLYPSPSTFLAAALALVAAAGQMD